MPQTATRSPWSGGLGERPGHGFGTTFRVETRNGSELTVAGTDTAGPKTVVPCSSTPPRSDEPEIRRATMLRDPCVQGVHDGSGFGGSCSAAVGSFGGGIGPFYRSDGLIHEFGWSVARCAGAHDASAQRDSQH